MKTHPINITSNNDNNNSNIYENFVNIELSKENKQLRQNMFEANNIISENQKEIHKYYNKVRYMKTLINNLSEFKSVYYNVYHNLNTHLNEDIRQYYNLKYDVYNLIIKIFVCQIFVFILFIILNSVNDKLSLTLFKYILLLFWLFNLTINYFKFYRYCHNFNIKQFNIMKNINSIIKTMLLNINKLE